MEWREEAEKVCSLPSAYQELQENKAHISGMAQKRPLQEDGDNNGGLSWKKSFNQAHKRDLWTDPKSGKTSWEDPFASKRPYNEAPSTGAYSKKGKPEMKVANRSSRSHSTSGSSSSSFVDDSVGHMNAIRGDVLVGRCKQLLLIMQYLQTLETFCGTFLACK